MQSNNPGAHVEEDSGAQLGAGQTPQPVISESENPQGDNSQAVEGLPSQTVSTLPMISTDEN